MNILHLEDDSPLREVLKFVLMTSAPEINLQQFMDSDQALVYIEAHAKEIDLFILDIRVPGSLDGLDLAQKIRDLECPGAIVVTSAYKRPSPSVMESLNCRWLPKPWHIMDAAQQLLPLARERYMERTGE
jgi:DNA-binding response OmpR family regulator